jgi:exosome complex exonuclease DIS3/RRP44
MVILEIPVFVSLILDADFAFCV